MDQSNAAATRAPADLTYQATPATPPPSKVGLGYLKFLIGTLVAFMLLIVGKIETSDHNSHSAGHVLLALALVAIVYAVFELSRALIGTRGRG
jgi:hypothetical protein